MPVLRTETSGAKMPLPGGAEYEARVLSIEQQEAANPSAEQLEKGDTSYLRWTFVTTENAGEFAGIELTANSSMKFGPKSKTREWANALLRTTLPKDAELDTDDLIGTVGAIYVEEDRKDADRVYAKITKLNRA
jgi:hypothetical protein